MWRSAGGQFHRKGGERFSRLCKYTQSSPTNKARPTNRRRGGNLFNDGNNHDAQGPGAGGQFHPDNLLAKGQVNHGDIVG